MFFSNFILHETIFKLSKALFSLCNASLNTLKPLRQCFAQNKNDQSNFYVMPRYARTGACPTTRRYRRKTVAKYKGSTRRPTASKTTQRQSGYVQPELAGRTTYINGSIGIRQGYVLPLAMFTTHRYASNSFGLTTSGVGLNSSTYWFRLNSLYAPDHTNTIAGPHQPYMYDQMRNMYLNSCVYAVRVNVKVISGSLNAGNSALIVCVKDNQDSSDPVGQTIPQWLEKPNSWTIQPRPVDTTAEAVVNEPRSLNISFDMAQLFGITRQELFADTAYSNLANSNPNRQWLLGVSAGDYILTANATTTIVVELEYKVRWTGPTVQNSS